MPGSQKSTKPVIHIEDDQMFMVAGYHNSRTRPPGAGNKGTANRRYRRAVAAEERRTQRRQNRKEQK